MLLKVARRILTRAIMEQEEITVGGSRPKTAEVVGQGYAEFWNFTGRYRVVKGGRGSKKSATSTLYYIAKMVEYWVKYNITINVLAIRRYYSTIKNSIFNQFKWAIEQFKLEQEFKITNVPMKITYLPSGGEIIFAGMDDSLKLTSIKASKGYLCFVLFEEAFEIMNEDDFNKVDMSIRGRLPEHLFYQISLIMNPWSEDTWIKKRFFDKVDPETGLSEDGQIMAITRNYDVNEFLDEQYLKLFEIMKVENPKRYAIEGLGEWGKVEGVIYENWEIKEFDPAQLLNHRVDGYQNYKKRFGLDWGFATDPTAFIAVLANEKNRQIYIYDEFYEYHLTNDEIVEQIKRHGFSKEQIVCDSAEPKSIEELFRKGINAVPCRKGADSVRMGIQKLRDFKLIVHPTCQNTIMELRNYCWDTDKQTGKTLNKPIDDFNHLLDSLRYCTEDISGITFEW